MLYRIISFIVCITSNESFAGFRKIVRGRIHFKLIGSSLVEEKFSSKRFFVVEQSVCLTKWHQCIFSVSLQFGTYYVMGQWVEFIRKMLLNAFFCFFCCCFTLLLLFFNIKFVFLLFHLFFWQNIKFPQQNINLSETWKKKLYVEPL